ncbi:SRPBCC family protein [Roseibium sp.]|uniref:SRPBCC family protein n=1 Tax=Roseibium sp. TaxID=1936156 RepID=UPI003A97CF0A
MPEQLPDDIRLMVELPLAPEDVWTVLTAPGHLRRWFGDHMSLEPKPGGLFEERWTRNGRPVVTSGHVITFEPPVRLVWTWADDDWHGDTRLSLELAPGPAGTIVTLVHSGWASLPDNSDGALRQDHLDGWAFHLSKLVSHAQDVSATSEPEPASRDGHHIPSSPA